MKHSNHSNIVNIFRESQTGSGQKNARPTKRAFFEVVSLDVKKYPVSAYVLGCVFDEDCGHKGGTDRERLHRFNLNCDLYKKRIIDIDRRFGLAFKGRSCPDHIMGVALDMFRCVSLEGCDAAPRVLRENIRHIAKNVSGFVLDSQPKQEDYAMLSGVEQMLVCDYISDNCNMLAQRYKHQHNHNVNSNADLKHNIMAMMKYNDIDFCKHDLGQCVTMRLQQLGRIKDRLSRNALTIQP